MKRKPRRNIQKDIPLSHILRRFLLFLRFSRKDIPRSHILKRFLLFLRFSRMMLILFPMNVMRKTALKSEDYTPIQQGGYYSGQY